MRFKSDSSAAIGIPRQPWQVTSIKKDISALPEHKVWSERSVKNRCVFGENLAPILEGIGEPTNNGIMTELPRVGERGAVIYHMCQRFLLETTPPASPIPIFKPLRGTRFSRAR
ncbi:hypothetical protein CDAR_217481 [Caerostris darwini]|uniref:Uncharacterized protein n=1 Tax=Caerostris darwini TaxID=1538125 RepID=A0AAV4SCW5_9ARAC|nr:hypothetical protein CDAR_217481 [Caerostris darwini]